MRRRSTYLLFICFLFLKGYGSIPAGEHKASHVHSLVQHIQNNDPTDLSSFQDPVVLPDDTLYIDDDDDNTETSGKGSCCNSGSTNDHIFPLHYFSNDFKNDSLHSKPLFNFPDKTIFLRVIKV